MTRGCLVAVAVLGMVCVEVCLAQWLLGLFGWRFDFLTVAGILVAVDILIGGLRRQ